MMTAVQKQSEILRRFEFYEQAKTAYCIISTGEKALYANIMLQKGVVINK